MTTDTQRIIEDYKPEKGYQPATPQGVPAGTQKPQGGYQPTSSGDNPANNPTPPSDE